jgi:replication fork clamp-binding protein CrfC
MKCPKNREKSDNFLFERLERSKHVPRISKKLAGPAPNTRLFRSHSHSKRSI